MAKKYSFDDHPEHREQLAAWRDKWIANAMSTKAMDDHDKTQMRIAIKGLYESAGLTPPPAHRIVFVPSPFVAAFAGGFAAAIWHNRKTDAATRAATCDATYDATNAATRAATDIATDAATRAATDAATRTKRSNNWYSSTAGFISAGKQLGVGKFGFECAAMAWRMYQGGNQWSAWDSFISFFRHIAKLDIDYSKYQYWEMAAIHGSYRIMHPDFCIVSDRPEILKVDEQNRPHCEDGPFCRWRDGMSLYAWHGVRIPEWWMTNRSELTPQVALQWENLEQRRAACEMIGWARILNELDAKTIDKDTDPQIGELVEVSLPDSGKERFLRVKCGTGRDFALAVPPSVKTAIEANMWTYGIEGEKLIPEIRT